MRKGANIPHYEWTCFFTGEDESWFMYEYWIVCRLSHELCI